MNLFGEEEQDEPATLPTMDDADTARMLLARCSRRLCLSEVNALDAVAEGEATPVQIRLFRSLVTQFAADL